MLVSRWNSLSHTKSSFWGAECCIGIYLVARMEMKVIFALQLEFQKCDMKTLHTVFKDLPKKFMELGLRVHSKGRNLCVLWGPKTQQMLLEGTSQTWPSNPFSISGFTSLTQIPIFPSPLTPEKWTQSGSCLVIQITCQLEQFPLAAEPPVFSELFKSRHTLLCQAVRKFTPMASTKLLPEEQATRCLSLEFPSFFSSSFNTYFCVIQ